MKFGLMFFASGEDDLGHDRYRLVLESAKFADQHGFSSIWVPERHFTPLGCLYPNPAVLQAALARETQQIRLQAGSVVLPLHDPIRVAEEWAMVDNLSDGRVGISFASGWNPGDFAFFPDHYAQRWQIMVDGIQTVRELWQGKSISVKGGDGQHRQLRVYPTPIQPQLPIWMTAASNPQTFIKAGEVGANLLTHLFDQDIAALAENIALYRQAGVKKGHPPGQVTVTLHAYLGADLKAVREQVRHPYCNYLKANLPLLKGLSYSRGSVVDLASLSPTDLDQMTERIFEKFFSEGRSLLGTPESCHSLVEQLHLIGVNEIACLLDFGPHPDLILQTLPHLNRLRESCLTLTQPSLRVPVHLPDRAASNPSPFDNSVSDDSVEAIQHRCQKVTRETFYQTLAARGVALDSSFQGIEQLWRREGEAIATLQLPKHLETTSYKTHPALLDACLQVFWATLPDAETASYLPVGLGELTSYGTLAGELYSHAVTTSHNDKAEFTGDVRVLDAKGTVLMTLKGVQLQRIQPTQSSHSDWFYQVQWQPHPLAAPLAFAPIADIAHQVRQQTSLEKLGIYPDLLPQLNTLSRDYILWAFQSMGVQFDQPFVSPHIQSQHHRLFERLLEILREQDVFSSQGQWQLQQAIQNPTHQLQTLQNTYPTCSAELTLLGRCGQNLAAVLKGQDPLELLFPDGSVADVEALYQNSPAAQVANQWVMDAISTAIESLPARPIRILEIGAGTGGTTAYVLPKLPADRTQYTFTDVSILFTTKAEQKFADYPFVNYRLLDIEQSPQDQGFEPQQFDIILAANVLHATSDLQQTIGHIHQLLAPGGLLIALEGMEPQAWLDLIFGLTPGWWSFTDTDLRPNYPLINGKQWQQLLQANQFETEFISADREGLCQQAVLVAAKQHHQDQGTWIICRDCSGIGDALATALESQGDVCHLLDSSDAAQFPSLLASINADGCHGVIYQWGLNNLEQTPLETPWQTTAPIALIQAMGQHKLDCPVWLVTQGSQAVEQSPVNAAQSMLWGLGQVLAVEQPQRYGGLIDLDPSAPADASAQDLLRILQNSAKHSPPRIWPSAYKKGGPGGPMQDGMPITQTISTGTSQDELKDVDLAQKDFAVPPNPPILGGTQSSSRVSTTDGGKMQRHGMDAMVSDRPMSYGQQATVIAFRNHQSWSPSLSPFTVPTPRSAKIQADASYLITGGLGDIGLQVANWLIEQGAKHLILMGRTALPPRPQWSSLADGDPGYPQTQAILAIEEKGTQVHLATADVADPEQLNQALQSLEGPAIRGVFHLAVVPPQFAALEQVDLDQLEQTLRPKVLGAWNLHQCFQNKPLDLFILFSSWAGLLGAVGQQLSGYSMANTYLDGLAHHRQALGLPALSLVWGDWAEIGLRTRSVQAGQRLLPESWTLTPEQGLAALSQAIDQQGQLAILPVPWPDFFELFPPEKVRPFFKDVMPQAATVQLSPTSLTKDWEALPPSTRLQALKTHVQEQVAQVMGIAVPTSIDPNRGLFEMGCDSLMALDIKSRLETSLGKTIPAVVAFEHPTVEALTTHLAESILGWELPTSAPANETPLDKIAQLSDDDVDRLFEEKFSR